MRRVSFRRTSASGTPASDADPSADATPGGSALQGHRVIWLVAVVAVVALTSGIVLSRFVLDPAEADALAKPPAAGLITIPVESRVVSNAVTTRADVLYDEADEVRIETSELSGAAVVTGAVPEVGATLEPASILLEIAGRPVITLPGALPAYRTLRVGVAGPDVVQLKQALSALGIDPGTEESDLYDADTAAAVDRLYVAVGYPSPSPDEAAEDAVAAARDAVQGAKDMLASAQADLTAAATGAEQVEIIAAQNAVNDAERTLAAVPLGEDPAPAQEALTLAVAQRDATLATPSTTAETTARNTASQSVKDAQADLAEALEDTLTHLPASEVAYFSSLPRRVDSVAIERADTVTATTAIMSVSSANLVVQGSVAPSEAELLAVGLVGTFELPDGAEGRATISEITAATASTEGDAAEGEGSTGNAAASDRLTVTFVPDALTPEQATALQGTNVRITIPVSSTGEAVLAVPAAALTAGPGGESRVERQTASGSTEVITVETGLVAGDGYVEIVSSAEPLAADDLVVVGR